MADGLYSSQGNMPDPTTEGTDAPQTNEKYSPSSSEWHLAGHPESVPDLLPTQGEYNHKRPLLWERCAKSVLYYRCRICKCYNRSEFNKRRTIRQRFTPKQKPESRDDASLAKILKIHVPTISQVKSLHQLKKRMSRAVVVTSIPNP